MEGENVDMEWIYDCVLQIVKSPEFRNPIKDFIDDNCGSFIGVDENTFEQGALHKEFIILVDSLLDALVKDMGITDEMFCMAAKKGLKEKEAKKYFEQLISFTNYNYFKNLMTKRNLYLEEMAFKEMMKEKEKEENEGGEDEGEEEGNEEQKELENKAKEMEDKELECALKMSLAVEEEKKKLIELEDEELRKAIELSLQEQKKNPEPTPLIQMGPQQPEKKLENPYRTEGEKEKEKEKEKEPPKVENKSEVKLNPIDKNALKQKMLQEHDEKMKNIMQTKMAPVPLTNAKGSEGLNKKLNEFEESKAKKLQEYREMILKMRKEKRQNELDNILNAGNDQKVSEEEQKRIDMRKQLAERLKSRLNVKK